MSLPLKETYYAIRIGDPRRHSPYLWVCDGKVPALFTTRAEANEAFRHFDDKTCKKVIRVRIST